MYNKKIKLIKIKKSINSNEEGIKALREMRAEAKKNGISNMSLEEINEEIMASRAERRKKLQQQL